MTEIALKIANQVIQLPEPRPRLVAGSAGVYAVTLAYDAQWDDATVRVVVFDGGLCNQRVPVQDTSGTVTIPAECIAHGGRGNWLQIGVLGYDGTGALRITTRAMLDGLRIDPAGASDFDVPQDAPAATPGLWEKLVADVGNLSDLQTSDTSSLVAAINELAADATVDATLSVDGVAADAAAVGKAVGKLDARLMSIPDIAMSGGTATTYTADSTSGPDGVNYTKVADEAPALWELIGGTITPNAVMGGSPPGYKWTITADRYIRLSDNAFGFEVAYAYGYVGVVVATAATTISPVLSDPETTAQIPEAGIYLGTLRREGRLYNYISSLTYSKGQTIDPRFLDVSGGDLFIVPVIPDSGKLTTKTTWQELQDARSAGKPLCANIVGILFTCTDVTDDAIVFETFSYDGSDTIRHLVFLLTPGENGETVVRTELDPITIPTLDDVADAFGAGTLRVTITGSGTTTDPYVSDVTAAVIHTALNAGKYVYAVQVLKDTTCRTFWHVDEWKDSDGNYTQNFKQLSTDGNAIYDLLVRVLNGKTDVRIEEGASADTEPLLLHVYSSVDQLSSTDLTQLNTVTGHPNRLVALVYHWRAPGQGVNWPIYMPLVEARSYGTWYFWARSEGTGTWSAEVSSAGKVTITRLGTDHTLGLTSATVGQIAKITAVDDNGAPTAWEAVDIKSDDLATWVNEKIDAKLGVIENGAY
nr:MAG TPA: hypothetical protein [Caudoviricetes sp.]